MKSSRGKILVTVGTTEFDKLISYTISPQFLQLLSECGYSLEDITYQIGSTGKIVPQKGKYFRLSPNIQQIYDQHDIILTHGGAGTLLACLYDSKPNKKIIAIANDTLAGNHQTELINKLHSQNYILGYVSVEQFKNNSDALKQLFDGKLILKAYDKVNKSLLNHLIFGEDL